MGACTSALNIHLRRRRHHHPKRKDSIETIIVENAPLFTGTNSLIEFYCPEKSIPIFTSIRYSSPSDSIESASIPFMSTTSSTTMSRPRGSIPRPVVPGFEYARATSLAVRSRSISPSSTITLQSVPNDPPIGKSSPLTNKTDLNGIRDRYRTHKRLHFFTRQSQPLKCVTIPPSAPAAPAADLSIREDSAYASLISPSTNTQRQRAISLLSSSSALSDVFNQDALFDDEYCSLKSVDLLCDQDDTLTLDSTSRNEQTRSCSSTSLSIESHSKNQRTIEETLDELPELTTQRKSSIRGKIDDTDHFTIDVESYRQVMKDVMVVKTLLHQLDRLLKQTDGNPLTDSMISSRHFSSSTIEDQTNNYDDLVKEITLLRKEREQDKQTIKFLQEQMSHIPSQQNNNSGSS